jgi:hypothetical protein
MVGYTILMLSIGFLAGLSVGERRVRQTIRVFISGRK